MTRTDHGEVPALHGTLCLVLLARVTYEDTLPHGGLGSAVNRFCVDGNRCLLEVDI